MPRSLTRPETGQIVWYFAASPPAAKPMAALVVQLVSTGTQGVGGALAVVNLAVFDPVTGAITAATGIPFHYGTRPGVGANPWCTMMRVNEPAVGVWPSAA